MKNKKHKGDAMAYHKRISLDNLRISEINRLEDIIKRLGYTPNDYKLNHFSNKIEMIVANQELHRDLKVIRGTRYEKTTVCN